MSEPQYSLDGDVAVVTLDDGKANAIAPETLTALNAALDRAEKEARALVIVGRPGKFCAGFNLAHMTKSDESMRSLVGDGARFLLRLYGFGLPTIVACTGHARAAGALILLSADERVGAAGDFKIGLNEVAIGMALPTFATELARERIKKAELTRATMQARVYDPAGAQDAGYLDRVVEPDALLGEAMATARALGELDTAAHRRTKRMLRGELIERTLAGLDDEMSRTKGPKAP